MRGEERDDGSGFRMDNWLYGDPCYDNWEGVECDASGDIVGLNLQGRRLSGHVTDEVVDLLPALSSLRKLEIEYNDLKLPFPPRFVKFVNEICAYAQPDGSPSCTGVPPYSCSAFGDYARLKLKRPDQCDPCDGDKTPTIILVVVTIGVVITALVLYVIVILRYPDALRRWVSYAIILANHTQTLSILGALDLAWPPVVRAILSALTLFQIESASCLLPAAVPSFWLYAFVVLGLSLLCIGGTTIAMIYCEYKGKRKQADRLDFIPSVVYAVLFVYSYQVCSAVLRTRGDLSRIGFLLAVPLLILLLLLLTRFHFKLKAFNRALSGGGWRGATWFSANGKQLHPKSLALQCYYLTYRFASHGQNWQFVIWLRQLSLIIAIGIV